MEKFLDQEKKTTDSIILGIDPGTKVTGYGIITKKNNYFIAIEFGCIRPSYKLSLNKRYFQIFSKIEDLIQKHRPSAIAIETQFVKQNVQVALKLGIARGTVIIAAEKNNIPIYEYSPKKAKLAVSGNGSASKYQVQKMVQMLLNIEEKVAFDAADALALAICHLNNRNTLCLNI